MTRLEKIVAVAVGVAALGACGAPPPEADVVIAPADLARALANDRKAALATYGGKVLELSGTVAGKIEPEGLNPTQGVVFAGIDQKLAFDSDLNFVMFDSEDAAATTEFESIAVGDAVTVVCRLEALNESGSLILVKGCRMKG